MSRRTFGLHPHHVRAVFERANEHTRAAGVRWYSDAITAVRRQLGEWHPPTATIAGVLAALSPRMPWERNVDLAADALLRGAARGALSQNCAKANAILAGADPERILSGRKVRAFYYCLAYPFSDAVCVDRHAVCVAAGRHLPERAGGAILARVGAYDRAAYCYRHVAAELGAGWRPMDVQAVTWLQWRKEGKA